jgi:hypothetical protein
MTRRFSAIGVCLYGFISAGLVACGDGGESKEGPWPNGSEGTKESGGSNATGGTSSKGGASNATGGKSTNTGGTSTATTTTTTTPVETCTASFVNLTDGGVLTDSQDSDGDYCQNGYSYNVVVATTAKDGTKARLILNGSEIATTTVANATAKFSNAPIGNEGKKTLEVEIGDTTNLCTTGESAVTVDCLGMPSCTVSTPTFDPTKRTALNFVAVASGGDRVSSLGSPYQTRLSVATNVENGQPVAVTVDGGTDKVYGVAVNGTATFPGVTLSPDGAHQVTATCTARSGANGVSSPISVNVDTTAPALTVAKGTGAGATVISALADGDHFGPSDDADPINDGLQLRLCGTTTDADATDLGTLLPAIGNNFCVAIGGNTPTCGAVKTVSDVKSACVNFTCPGNGPFDLTLTLKDDAQNPTTLTRTGLTCAAANPNISFLDPVANDETFSDKSKRILASYNTEATRMDMNPTQAGSQYVVTACTSAPAGSTGTLKVGRVGETLLQVATVTSVASPNCSGSKLEFPLVTLPESLNNSDFTLKTATQVQVNVIDNNLGTGTSTIDVWVDSNSPLLSLSSPIGLCGKYYASTSDVSESVVFSSSVASPTFPVTLVVTDEAGTPASYDGTVLTFSQTTINNVIFKVGKNKVSASVHEPSGNYRLFGGNSCTVEVGGNPPPTVTWQKPLSTSLLTAAGNSSPNAIIDADAAAGWQGQLKVRVESTASLAGMTVQFSANGTPIGSPVSITLDVGDNTKGYALLDPATVPEGAAVELTATTSTGTASAGSAAITVPVDVTVPSTPTALSASVPVAERRIPNFKLDWTAAADGLGKASGYLVRVSKTAIQTDTEFNNAKDITYSGVPASNGNPDSLTVNGISNSLLIEKDYFFAIAAVDIVGNRSGFVSTSSATRSVFLSSEMTPSTTLQRFGSVIDGTGDLNKDGYSDLIVNLNNGNEVQIFFGSSTGVATTPDVRIQGTVSQFGTTVAAIGDINKDGYEDMAIGSAREGAGIVYVFYGRTKSDWALTPTLSSSNADLTVGANSDTTSGGDAKFANSRLGSSVVRLGDFNGDSVDDFAVSAFNYNSSTGLIAVVLGKAKASGAIAPIVLSASASPGIIRIDGDTTGSRFGFRMVGTGRFYGGSLNPGLVVSAPYMGTNLGRMYSFVGATGTPTSIALSTAQTVNGVAGEYLGFNGISLLGNLGPGGQMALGLSIIDLAPDLVYLYSGTTATGPFDVRASYKTSELGTDVFGRMVVGGGVSGWTNSVSVIGNEKSDLVISTLAGGKPRLFVIDGTKVSLPASLATIDETNVDVVVNLPGTFTDFARSVTIVPDIDGDGHADLAVADTDFTASNPITGRVVVLR